MNSIIEFLTSQEIIMVYIVATIGCVLATIIYLIDKSYYKRKRKQNTKELNRLVENIDIEKQEEKEVIVKTIENNNCEEPVMVETVVEPPVARKVLDIEEKIEDPLKEAIQPQEIKEETTINNVIEEQIVEPVIEEQEIITETVVESVVEEEPIIIETTIEKPIVEEVENTSNPTTLEELIEELEIEENNIAEAKEEALIYTTIEPNKTEAQETLRKLTEELEKAMEEKPENIDLTSFEEEQERDAIISLEELIKRSKEMYETNELYQYEDEGNEPISLADLERKIKEATLEEEIVSEPIIETIEEPTIEPIQEQLAFDYDSIELKPEPEKPVYQNSFKSSPIISPIFGLPQKVTDNDMELENTANYEKLDQEIKKTNEFLMTLRELQKNLE